MSGDTPTLGPFDADYWAVCDEHERTYPAGGICEACELARLRAESTVLTSVAEALADPDRPEESPVDAVRRLRAEVAQLKYELDYTPPPGAVSDHVRKRIAEAGRAALDGKGGCPGEACVPAHQAGEVLDAHDDAQAEVERLTAERNFIDDQRIEQGRNLRAEVERLTRERDAAKARSASDGRVVVQMGIRNREMMGARDDAQARLADVIGWATRAHKSKDWSTYAVLEGLLSRLRSLCPEDTPKPGGIVEAFAALREACAGEYDGVDAAAFVDELRGKGPEDSTTEANPAKGVDAFFGTMTSEETDEEFLAMVGADGTDEMTVWREWAKASMVSVEEHEANRALEAAEDVAASAPTCECGPGARTVDGVCTDCSLQVETGCDQ